jgi:type VI secretion system protein ImpK
MERVNAITKDCFNALIQMRNIGDDAMLAPEMFHARIIGFIDELFARGQQAGLPERDVQDIAYAMVALADEIAFRKSGGIRDVWMSRPLQLHYFNENLAGEGFFHRLEYVMADPRRIEVLRVFFVCLLFGFQGKYAVRGGELELAVVHRRAREALAHALKPEPLSRRAQRPRERVVRAQQGWLTVWIGLFAVLFSLALIIVLRRALDSQSGSLIERIDALLTLTE